jgi:threonine aldolase
MEQIDLRSDTVTRPTAGMREAMARAEVGDDVFGEDPTVRALEERVAALLGKEAALFTPSGTAANQIGLLIHCRPGDDVILGEGAHQMAFEAGAGGAIAGVQFSVAGRGGLFEAADVRACHRSRDTHFPPTALVSVENTHNRAGGRIWPLAQLRAVTEEARSLGLRLHLDGARLLNAVVASGTPAADWAASFDTVTQCFSKGLGAPVGSAIAGTREHVRLARRYRKMLGGGMRQAGVLAAAALYALEHHVDRLAEDHQNARRIAATLGRAAHGRVLEPVDTNMVMLDLLEGAPTAAEAVAAAKARGLLVLSVAPRRIRIVTHLDVDRAACERGASLLLDVVEGR